MGIDAWSTTAASNNASPPDGAPEGMAAGTVNNTIRQVMASVRTWFEDAQWINLGLAPTLLGGTSFSLTGDVTNSFHVGRRVKVTGSATGYATISASVFNTPNTTITVAMDSGSLPVTLSAVYLSILSSANTAVPTQNAPIWTGAATGGSLTLSTPLGVASGGTGSGTVAGARSALSVSATGSDTTYSFRANNLSDLSSIPAARSNLGLVIGTDVPSVLGSGAAGTWSINITGNASTATLAATATNVTGPVAIANGGTSASSAASARSNLGLVAVASSGSAADLTTGNIADARVPVTAVTQHQASITSIGASATINSVTIGYRYVPRRTSGFLNGECLAISAGVTLNTSDMSAGYCFSVYNDSGSSITITAGGGVTQRLAGSATTGNRTIAQRGIATIWCNSSSEAIFTGAGVS